jgi:hypothetical protein
MDSTPVRGEASRRRAEGQFKAKKNPEAQTQRADTAVRQAEAEKTVRLRALRQAKEAADRDAADREAAAALARRAELRRRAPKPRPSDGSEPT